MRHSPFLAVAATALALASSLSSQAAAPAEAPAGDPAAFEIAVEPGTVQAGSSAQVTLRLVPAKGIKINRYPKIRLTVKELPGLVAAAEGATGNDAPPPPDKIEGNYFTTIDPVTFVLPIEGEAAKGRHEIPARLSYFYCVAASGYCAPAKVPVKIPITVR